MNNRFKFRVWSDKHKMYVEDNSFPIGGDYSLSMTQYGYVEVIGLGDYQEGSDTTHSWGRVKNLREYIGECIIEQCTGLKDKNGKLIYEGDIVREISKKEPEWEEYIITVEWKGCGFNLYRDDEFDFLVIGNIHKNADLLESEKCYSD